MGANLTAAKAKQGAEAVSDKLDKDGIVTAVGQALIFGIFALFDELVVDTNFKCPCISPDASSDDVETSCEWNTIYSLLFIVLTTILAAFLGTAALFGVTKQFFAKKEKKQDDGTSSGKAQDTTTAIQPESERAGTSSATAEVTIAIQAANEQAGAGSSGQGTADGNSSELPTESDRCASVTCPCTKTQFKLVVFQFFVIGAAWLSIICIDGDYIACAITCSPYGNASCVEVRKLSYNELPFSKEFLRISRRISQPSGIVLGIVVAVAVLSSVIPCSAQCKKGACNECNENACCSAVNACCSVVNACCKGNTCCCCVFKPDVEQGAGDAQAKSQKKEAPGSSGQPPADNTI